MSFKVGDRVRCVRPDGYGVLVKNQIYIVTDSTVGSKGELIMLKGICSPGGTALYFANRFELVESEEPKVGDVLVNKHLGVVKVYDTSTPNIGIRVQLENGTLIYVSPELLKGETPTDHRDRVPSVGKMVGVLPVDGCDTLDALMYWKSAYNRSLIARISPTVTKIVHNGITTITFFSDGKKVITRPSQDDAEKYDPFVGWCVGVVEHLYGGKEKAKKFYKKHAVVQKGTRKAAFVKEEPNLDCKNCLYYQNEILTSPCSICVSSYESIENKWSKPSRWEPKENTDLNSVIAETKAVEKEQEPHKDCCNCKYDGICFTSQEPCKSCLYDYSKGKSVTKWEPKEEAK